MSYGLRIVLLVFATVGYIGAGVSLAVSRQRKLMEGARDLGMLGVAGMLFLFAALCTSVGVGAIGILAFGGVILWASYLFMAQRVGLFRIEAGGPPSTEEESSEEPRRAK
jgi:threonine/homoserine efflux transporter RhtA